MNVWEPIYGEDGEECYLLPVSSLITLNSTSAQSRLRCSAFVIGHDCLLSNMARWLHSAIWRNSSREMYLSKLARAEIINLDFLHSEVPPLAAAKGGKAHVARLERERIFPRVSR